MKHSDSTNQIAHLNRKKEINQLLDYINENPWPEGIEAARIHYDSLGPAIASDITVDHVKINNVNAQILTPPVFDANRIILYLHGGGFVFGSLKSHGGMVAEISRAASCKVLQLDYRLAPEHPFPAALEDSYAAYKWILDHGYKPEHIIIAGDSAGGGLVISTLLYLKEHKYILPAAAICICPWIDAEFVGESFHARKDIDPLVQQETCKLVTELYLNGHNPRDPLVSPIHADLTGFPPLFIQVGECEILHSDSVRLVNIAHSANVEVNFEEWPDMVHVWHLHYLRLTDGVKAIQRIGQYAKDKTHG